MCSSDLVWSLNIENGNGLTISGDRLTYVGSKSNRMDVYRVAPSSLSYVKTAYEWSSDRDTGQFPNATRVDVTDTSTGTSSYFLHVIGTGTSATSNPVSSVASSPATGQTGVQVNLADGRVAIIRFNNTSSGGTIQINDASGNTVVSGSLATTVTKPPIFRN